MLSGGHAQVSRRAEPSLHDVSQDLGSICGAAAGYLPSVYGSRAGSDGTNYLAVLRPRDVCVAASGGSPTRR